MFRACHRIYFVLGIILSFWCLSSEAAEYSISESSDERLRKGGAYGDADTRSSVELSDLIEKLCPKTPLSNTTPTTCHQGLKTIEAVLASLPNSYRKNYLLMFKSGSLQEASYQNPRAILFGETADLMMSFNGIPSQKGYWALETIAWQEETRSFEFREIMFSKNQTGPVVVSKKNPAKCLRCHRADPRPNWHHYQFWPGAYGQLDDLPTIAEKQFKLPSTGEYVMVDNREAASQLPLFIERSKSHPRYKYLLNMEESHMAPEPGERSGGIPNQVFTVKVAEKNFKRITRMMRALPQYPLLRWLVAGAFKCDNYSPYENQKNSFPSFFPDELRELRSNVLYSPDRVNGTRLHYSIMQYMFEMLGMEDYRFEDWFMNTQPGFGNSFESAGTAGGIQIMYHLALLDPEYRKHFNFDKQPFRRTETGFALFKPGVDCHTMRDLSLAEFAKLKEKDHQSFCNQLSLSCANNQSELDGLIPINNYKQPRSMSSCIDCHDSYETDYNMAPAIPFGDPYKLSTALNRVDVTGKTLYDRILWRISEKANGDDRMPKFRRPLNEEAQAEIKSYLDKLR